jgi:hypothetical protein
MHVAFEIPVLAGVAETPAALPGLVKRRRVGGSYPEPPIRFAYCTILFMSGAPW